jgi:hypothetical protein
MTYDMNDAELPRGSDLIPDGSFVKVIMHIRKGGLDGQGEADRGLLKGTKTPGSDVKMLDCEFTVMVGPHIRRKFWQTFTVSGGKLDEQGVSIGWKITAKLRQLPVLLLIDNLRQELDSAALAAALTAPAWEDRLLGASDMIRLPVRCAWVATANNPTVSHEIARRLVRIRLDARTDQPWRRDGFRHPDLMVWVRSNRARLVSSPYRCRRPAS